MSAVPISKVYSGEKSNTSLTALCLGGTALCAYKVWPICKQFHQWYRDKQLASGMVDRDLSKVKKALSWGANPAIRVTQKATFIKNPLKFPAFSIADYASRIYGWVAGSYQPQNQIAGTRLLRKECQQAYCIHSILTLFNSSGVYSCTYESPRQATFGRFCSWHQFTPDAPPINFYLKTDRGPDLIKKDKAILELLIEANKNNLESTHEQIVPHASTNCKHITRETRLNRTIRSIKRMMNYSTIGNFTKNSIQHTYDVAKLLIENGASIDPRTSSDLLLAAAYNDDPDFAYQLHHSGCRAFPSEEQQQILSDGQRNIIDSLSAISFQKTVYDSPEILPKEFSNDLVSLIVNMLTNANPSEVQKRAREINTEQKFNVFSLAEAIDHNYTFDEVIEEEMEELIIS